MTHRIYKSTSVDARLVTYKRRPHGRQRNVRRCWKLRHVTFLLPGRFGDERALAEVQLESLRTIRCPR